MAFPTTVLLAIVAIISYSVIKRIIHANTSPLSKIPGPTHTKYTSLISNLHRIKGTKTYYVSSLHERYGPVVRVEPNQVSSSDPSHWEHIFRMGAGFKKAAFHERLRVGPEVILFSMVDAKRHASRRRLFARALGKEVVRRNWEGVIKGKVGKAVGLIKREIEQSGKGESDMLKWWRLMANDVIGALSFGEGEFEMLDSHADALFAAGNGKDKDKGEKEYFEALQNAGVGIILRDIVPAWLLQLFVKLGWPKRVGEIMRANEVITAKGAVAVRNARKKKGVENLFRNMLDEAEKDREGGNGQDGIKELTDDAIISEAAGFLLAGSDTTSISITYILWAILKREDLRKKLEEEVEMRLGEEDFTDKDVEEKCPLLNSTIEESMRLYNPAAGTIVRRTPPGGVTWNGYFIPGGDEVYVMPYMLARNKEVFPDPERFDETRFLNPTDMQRRLAKPFGIGVRSCIGVPVAQMEIRLAVALFLRECKGARLGKNMTDDMMEQRTKFFTYPKGGRCDIRLGDE